MCCNHQGAVVDELTSGRCGGTSTPCEGGSVLKLGCFGVTSLEIQFGECGILRLTEEQEGTC